MVKKAWTDPIEQLILTWAEKASGYAWLHRNSCLIYKRRNLYISIPTSIFSYIAGITILFSNDGHVNADLLKGIVGIFAIMAGILSNFQEMFTFKEESEKHRIASLRFLSFFREISCELSLEPSCRSSPMDYLTIKRFEYDKILEQSPDIPELIIKRFNKNFKHLHIHKPDATIGLQTIIPYGKNKYKKELKLKEKLLLLKYFEKWEKNTTFYKCSNSHVIEIANSGSVGYNSTNIKTRTLSERDYTHLLFHGTLGSQKTFLQNQNIKIRRNPLTTQI
jgi:hypothetical protein